MRAARLLLCLLLGAMSIALMAEAVLRLLPVPDGLYAADPSPEWDARRLPPNSEVMQSFRWDLENHHQAHVNNTGFPASFDYRPGAAVGVVIGDSFVEGLSNDEAGRLQTALARALHIPPEQIYSFGTSGASLPHYLGIARHVGRHYRPTFGVVVINQGDFVEGFAKAPGFFHWVDGPELVRLSPELQRSAWTKFARDLALNRYVRSNLQFSLTALFSSGLPKPGHVTCPQAELSARDRLLLDGWLAAMPDALGLPRRSIVLAFDDEAARTALQSGGMRGCTTRDDLARAYLLGRARLSGFGLVDTTPLFARAWAVDHIPIDHSPADSAHWTPYGNKLVADAVVNAIVR